MLLVSSRGEIRGDDNPMTKYSFVTTWRLPAVLGRVWDTLMRAEKYPRWWKSMVHYR